VSWLSNRISRLLTSTFTGCTNMITVTCFCISCLFSPPWLCMAASATDRSSELTGWLEEHDISAKGREPGNSFGGNHNAVTSGVALSTCAFWTSGDRGQTSDRDDHGLEVPPVSKRRSTCACYQMTLLLKANVK
jgi:hypothetical protein